MDFELTDSRRPDHEELLVGLIRDYNDQFVERDFRPLSIDCRDTEGQLIGGLSGKTHGGYLEIMYLWVAKECRGTGVGKQLMSLAESEARDRGCRFSHLDTFSFQALGFYRKLGYDEFGSLGEYYESAERHYLVKRLVE